MYVFLQDGPKQFINTFKLFAGGHGQVVCQSVMRQRRAQTPQRQGLCSSSGRTQAQELSFGLTQRTKYPKSEPGSCDAQVLCRLLLKSAVTDRRVRIWGPGFGVLSHIHAAVVNMFLYDLKVDLVVVSWAINGNHLLINVNRTVEMTQRSFSFMVWW